MQRTRDEEDEDDTEEGVGFRDSGGGLELASVLVLAELRVEVRELQKVYK
jgi:hypothetical protein